MVPYIPLIVALLSTGGLIGGIIALVKLRPEAGQIIVTQAQGAVIVQGTVIEDLRRENHDLKEENATLRKRVASLEEKVSQLEKKVNGS